MNHTTNEYTGMVKDHNLLSHEQEVRHGLNIAMYRKAFMEAASAFPRAIDLVLAIHNDRKPTAKKYTDDLLGFADIQQETTPSPADIISRFALLEKERDMLNEYKKDPMNQGRQLSAVAECLAGHLAKFFVTAKIMARMNEAIAVAMKTEEVSQCVQDMRLGQQAKNAYRHYRSELDALIHGNMRLVAKIASSYRDRGVMMEDMIQEGATGLMRAAEKYDPTRGLRFSTYATHWIRASILVAISQSSREIRLSAGMHDMVVRVMTERNRRIGKGLPFHAGALAEELNMSIDDVRDALRNSQDTLSINAPIGSESEGLEVSDMLVAEGYDVEGDLELAQREGLLARLMDSLGHREALVIRKRFGLGCRDELNFEQIGAEIGLTKERARQIEKSAINKLRAELEFVQAGIKAA